MESLAYKIQLLVKRDSQQQDWRKIYDEFINFQKRNANFSEEIRKNNELLKLYARASKETGKILECVDFLINKVKIYELCVNEIETETIKTLAYLLREYYKLKTSTAKNEKNDVQDEEPCFEKKSENQSAHFFVDKNILNQFCYELLKNLSKESESDKKLYYSLLFKMLKYEAKSGEPNWELVNKTLSEVDPYQINEQPHKLYVELANGEKKLIESASDLENYYSLKSKALIGLEKYDEALYVCLEAFSRIKNFHLYNDIWLKRKMAAIYVRKKDYDKAYKIYAEIFSKKKDWFLIKDFADMYSLRQEYNLALYYYICAALAKGSVLNKVQLYYKIGETLEVLGKSGEDHFQLAYKIRKKMNWEPETVEPKLINKNDNKTIEETYAILMKYWVNSLEEGKIAKLFLKNKFGFIEHQNKEFIFKFASLSSPLNNFELNKQVKFAKLPSYDYKAKRFSEEVFFIEYLQE